MRCPTERMGGEYGGYVMCPLGLTDRSVVYSLGVGEDIAFDLELIDRLSATVHAFDRTPRPRSGSHSKLCRTGSCSTHSGSRQETE